MNKRKAGGAALAGLLVLATAPCSSAAGFRQATAPDGGGPPLMIAIWYPSRAAVSPMKIGPYTQMAARDAPVAGGRHPLIVLSHGSGGSPFNHYDLAIRLADAGFVVAAPAHTGDNYADSSAAGFVRDLVDRPRHIVRTLDYMTTAWSSGAAVDPRRIGGFGFSLGGLTMLTLAGGAPELSRLAARCRAFPASVECAFVAAQRGDQLDARKAPPEWLHDRRIKAIAVAAPAVTLLFAPADLRAVHIPVQMWRGATDANVPDAYDTAQVRAGVSHLDEQIVPKAGHFVFQAPCDETLRNQAPVICVDPPGVDRAAVHDRFNAAVLAFFQRTLAPNQR